MYSEDEEIKGFPDALKKLNRKIQEADFLIISTPEHNGNLPAFFKNIIDWLSRLNYSFLTEKKVLVLSASPGKGGGASALKVLKNTLPYFGAEIVGEFSLGGVQHDFFSENRGLDEVKANLLPVLNKSFHQFQLN